MLCLENHYKVGDWLYPEFAQQEEPFLALMGMSLDWVLIISRWSVGTSPEIDLPRMGSAGLALATLGIAVFCLASRRGRMFAAAPVAAKGTACTSCCPTGWDGSTG